MATTAPTPRASGAEATRTAFSRFRGPVGGGLVRAAHRPYDHDRAARAQRQVDQEGRLLERVRPVRHDDAVDIRLARATRRRAWRPRACRPGVRFQLECAATSSTSTSATSASPGRSRRAPRPTPRAAWPRFRVGQRGDGAAGREDAHRHGRDVKQTLACPACRLAARREARSARPLSGEYDVLVCGASFAGLTVARELTGSGAARPGGRPLRDRRAPDLRLRDPDRVAGRDGPDGIAPADLRPARGPHPVRDLGARPALDVLDVRLPRPSAPPRLPIRLTSSTPPRSTAAPATRSTPTAAIFQRPDRRRPRLAAGARHGYQPPDAPLSRGLEVHPWARATSWRSGSTAGTSRPATAGASRPTTRRASASAPSTRASTSRTRP